MSCGTRHHFRRIGHPHLGHCAQGDPEPIAGLWDTEQRSCTRWLPLVQNLGAKTHG